MRCYDCGKECESINVLSEYGRNKMNTKDIKERCEECFTNKFPRLHERNDNEKSNDKE